MIIRENGLLQAEFPERRIKRDMWIFFGGVACRKFKGIMEFADKPTSIERLAEKVTSADW